LEATEKAKKRKAHEEANASGTINHSQIVM
jgi:hypothetical protein